MKAIALVASAALVCLAPAVRAADYPVSYTHLTLPTIYSV